MSLRNQIRADLLAPIAQHREIVVAITAVPYSPASEAEFRQLKAYFVTVRDDPETIPAVTGQIFDHSVRLPAVAIHLTRECDKGVANGLTAHWDELSADTQAELTNSLYGRLLVLRETARRVHAQSEEQIDETVDELISKVDSLPVAIREQLIETTVSGQLNISLVHLIKKLHMLQSEWPEMMKAELEGAL